MSEIDGIEVGNCAKCPEIIHCLKEIRIIDETGVDIAMSVMDPKADNNVQFVYDTFRDSGLLDEIERDTGDSIVSPADLLMKVRQTVAEGLEMFDEDKTV